MKNVMIVCTLLMGLTINAQSHGPKDRGPHHERMQQAELTPEQIAELRVKELTLLLDLSETQQKKIASLELEAANNRQAQRAMQKEAKQQVEKDHFKLRSEQLDHEIAFKKSMRSILDEEQFEKWEKSHSARAKKLHRKEHHRTKHGKRH